LIEFANAQPPQRYGSRMAPEVVACAEEGDVVAIEILERGGADLAYLAGLLIERMRRNEAGEFKTPAVAIAGSILAKVDRVRTALRNNLRARYDDVVLIEQPVDPVYGALWRARRDA
jgi:N-acetylglucosamine kinase-like BadF-type ATPase